MPWMSASWKASEPIAPLGTWPVIATIATESMYASAIGVTRLVAPGPDVAMQTPTLPVACAYPVAAWPAPCSCRTRMWRTFESKIGSYAGRMAPPGMPNMTSTPSDSSERTSAWAPVTGSGLVAGAPAAVWPAAPVAAGATLGAWARCPAATVSGDVAGGGGRRVGCSAGVFVMTVAFGSAELRWIEDDRVGPDRRAQKSPRAGHVGSRVGRGRRTR